MYHTLIEATSLASIQPNDMVLSLTAGRLKYRSLGKIKPVETLSARNIGFGEPNTIVSGMGDIILNSSMTDAEIAEIGNTQTLSRLRKYS